MDSRDVTFKQYQDVVEDLDYMAGTSHWLVPVLTGRPRPKMASAWSTCGRPERLSFLDEDYQRFGQDAVVRHRICRLFGLHRTHESIHVCNVHENSNPSPVLWVNKRPNVRDAEGPKELFPLRRGEPMIRVLDVVVTDDRWHGSPFRVLADRCVEPYELRDSTPGSVRPMGRRSTHLVLLWRNRGGAFRDADGRGRRMWPSEPDREL